MTEVEGLHRSKSQNSSAPQCPTKEKDRLANLDIIRGIALLGILIMNIQSFSMIVAAYANPLSFGDFSGSNQSVYYFSHLFADQKFMSIFAALFGVGILLMASSLDKKGFNTKKLHYRRMIILAVFGLMHSYLFWYGDILFAYAITGMVVFSMRHKSPRFLLIGAFLALLLNAVIFYLPSAALPYMNETDLQELMTDWLPSQALIDAEVSANQVSWLGQMALTNYLSQTLICTFIFYGWGLGKFGTVDRKDQLLIVIIIWIVQLLFSTTWMKRFKFGPFEWLWRSLTYGARQPLRKS